MSNGNILYGQQYDEQTDVALPFTEQIENFENEGGAASLGNARTEILPVDYNASKVRTFTPPTQEQLDEAAVKLYENISFTLPDTLLGVTAYYTQANGVDGSASETGDGASVGATGSLSINLSSSSQGAAAISPEVFINIRPNVAVDVPCTVHLFYIADTSTRAQILSKLSSLAGATVLDWPQFKPKATTLFLLSQQVELSARANLGQTATVTDTTSSYAKSEGTSVSKSLGVTMRVVTIPPTIHGSLTITNSATVTKTVNAGASVQVTRSGAGWLDGTYWPERTVTTSPNPATATAAATVLSEAFNSTIPTTGGTTDVPNSGLYARLQTQPWKFGFMQVRAEVVNFNIFS